MAVPRSQHSPTLGQLASSQTVCRPSAADRRLEAPVVRPAGRRHLQPGRLAGAAERHRAVGRHRGPAGLGAGAGDVSPLGRSAPGQRPSCYAVSRRRRRSYRELSLCPIEAPFLVTHSALAISSAWSALTTMRANRSPKRSATVSAKRLEVLLGASSRQTEVIAGPLDAAGNNPLERLQVVVDIYREAVGRDAAADMHADRADLSCLLFADGPISDRIGAFPSRRWADRADGPISDRIGAFPSRRWADEPGGSPAVHTPVSPSIVVASTP